MTETVHAGFLPQLLAPIPPNPMQQFQFPFLFQNYTVPIPEFPFSMKTFNV